MLFSQGMVKSRYGSDSDRLIVGPTHTDIEEIASMRKDRSTESQKGHG